MHEEPRERLHGPAVQVDNQELVAAVHLEGSAVKLKQVVVVPIGIQLFVEALELVRIKDAVGQLLVIVQIEDAALVNQKHISDYERLA